jgi:hypothetical protein
MTGVRSVRVLELGLGVRRRRGATRGVEGDERGQTQTRKVQDNDREPQETR